MLDASDVTSICPNALVHRRGSTHHILIPEEFERQDEIEKLCDEREVDYQIGYRQKCEVYSRVMGYYRPVSQWNTGKQSEWVDRKEFTEEADSGRLAMD